MTDPTPTEAAGEAIRRERKAAGLTQAALADLIGSTQATVCRWEDGSRTPDVAALAAIADALSITIVDLLDNQPPHPRPTAWDRLEAKLDRILELLEARRTSGPDSAAFLLDQYAKQLFTQEEALQHLADITGIKRPTDTIAVGE